MYASRHNPDDEAEAIFERILAERVAQDPEWADFAERNRPKIMKQIRARLRAQRKAELAERRAAAPTPAPRRSLDGPKPEPLMIALGKLDYQGARTPMYAATGKTYRIVYAPILTNADGTGPVLASNLPSGKPTEPVGPPTPGYPIELQARSLLTPGEQSKIATIATGLDPARLIAPHSDPTLGPPVVWPMTGGEFPVVAGNSRVVALLAAPPSRYQAYEKALQAWGRQAQDYEIPAAPPGHRWVLTRVLLQVDDAPVSFAEAVKLAGASQESTAGVESTIGKALSTLRALGIGDVSRLPQLAGWSEAVHQDNVGDFIAANRGFWQGLLERVPAERRGHYESDSAAAAELARNVFVGFLPPEVRQRGFGDRKTEQALVSALPAMVTIHQLVMEGQVKPDWDLLPRLPLAVEVYDSLRRRNLSVEGAVKLLEQESRQVKMAGATTLLSEVSSDPLAFVLAVMLYKAARRTAPELAVGEYLTAYTDSAIADSPHQVGMFGAAQAPDPASKLAHTIGMRMPKLRSNPRRKAALKAEEYYGKQGRTDHITRYEEGTIPTSEALKLQPPHRYHKRRKWKEKDGKRYFGSYSEARWNEFLEDIRKNGIKTPLWIQVDPGIGPLLMEGNHRVQAAAQLGLAEVPVTIKYYGLAEEEGLVAPSVKRTITHQDPERRSNPHHLKRRDCGDCFEANGRYLMEHGEIAYPPRDSMRLVHGEVTGQGRLEGINFGHAWIEYDGVDEAMVLDLSNGKHMEVPRRFYYAMGGIAENDNMHVYDYDEVAEKIRRYQHWGPWDLKTSTGH